MEINYGMDDFKFQAFAATADDERRSMSRVRNILTLFFIKCPSETFCHERKIANP